ncbi:hypothetical protein ACFE04_007589 [Oxalis oulophora]
MDSFFSRGFKASKCKTLLKLTIPRIKLLRNRREIQIRNMRRDIAKLLETGQEATARIRVEHIIREENMMAAQEILELFSELIAVRLPIIETQRECPLDLKEAISSVCFAAPRCADLPELLQVQMLFGAKYGKEFLAAATGLMPECGVNRQLIELLSVRAPAPETKLKLLKEIAEEHGLDWDPAPTETEFLRRHEDLLNGPTKLPLPEEKDDESFSGQSNDVNEKEDPDADFEILDFPEVPKMSIRSNPNTVSAPVMLPFPGDTPEEIYHVHESLEHSETTENKTADDLVGPREDKQFVPFMSPPTLPSPSLSTKQSSPPSFSTKQSSPPRVKSEATVDLQDVLAAAHNAAEAAERAAAAARSAASLAQTRIAELSKKSDPIPENIPENPFFSDFNEHSATKEKKYDYDCQNSLDDTNDSPVLYQAHEDHKRSQSPDLPSVDKLKIGFDDSPLSDDHLVEQEPSDHQPQRLASNLSGDDDAYLAYPNLFSRQSSDLAGDSNIFNEDSQSTHNTTHGH